MASSRVRNQVRALVILTLTLTLFPACEFVTGVGDPVKAKVDKSLSGYWYDESSGNVHVLIATPRKEGKTYDFDWITGEGSLAEPSKVTLPLGGQAWLSQIDSTLFVTAKFERASKDLAMQIKEKPYEILKVQHSGDSVTLTKLNAKTEDFSRAKTPTEMEAAIKAHLGDTSAYEGTCTMKRTTAEATKKLRDLAAAKRE